MTLWGLRAEKRSNHSRRIYTGYERNKAYVLVIRRKFKYKVGRNASFLERPSAEINYIKLRWCATFKTANLTGLYLTRRCIAAGEKKMITTKLKSYENQYMELQYVASAAP